MSSFSSDNFTAALRNWEAMNSDPPEDDEDTVQDDEPYDPHDDPG